TFERGARTRFWLRTGAEGTWPPAAHVGLRGPFPTTGLASQKEARSYASRRTEEQVDRRHLDSRPRRRALDRRSRPRSGRRSDVHERQLSPGRGLHPLWRQLMRQRADGEEGRRRSGPVERRRFWRLPGLLLPDRPRAGHLRRRRLAAGTGRLHPASPVTVASAGPEAPSGAAVLASLLVTSPA